MVKRNHPLQIGEKVFDSDTMWVFHIHSIATDGTVTIKMTPEDIQENTDIFNDGEFEITPEETERTVTRPNDLYQFAPNLVARDGNPICYEHNKFGEYEEEGGDYPYYSPYLDENLYTIEVFTPEEYDAR